MGLSPPPFVCLCMERGTQKVCCYTYINVAGLCSGRRVYRHLRDPWLRLRFAFFLTFLSDVLFRYTVPGTFLDRPFYCSILIPEKKCYFDRSDTHRFKQKTWLISNKGLCWESQGDPYQYYRIYVHFSRLLFYLLFPFPHRSSTLFLFTSYQS